MGKPSTLAACLLAEFLGTFFLVFTVGMNVLVRDAVWGGISIGSVLMVSVYALGGISGANFNPAVTFALALVEFIGGPVKGFLYKKLFLYWGAQIVGGIAGGFCYRSIFDQGIRLGPQDVKFGPLDVGILEIIYTFMLCFVVLNVAVAQENQPNQYFGIAIGGVIFAGAYGAGAVCGGCFNPAVALGLDISHINHFAPKWSPFYVLCHLLAGALAVGCFRLVRSSNFPGGSKEHSEGARFLAEFLGTYMLVVTVGLNVLAQSPAGAYSIASSLMSMIYALGSVSGAHFNPAVTIAVWITGRTSELTPKRVTSYVTAQMLAGKLGAMTYTSVYFGETFQLGPRGGYGMEALGIVEVAFTLLLSYVVLAVAVSTTTNSSNNFGFAIGACVTVAGNAAGPISGGAFNPAVAFGIGTSSGAFWTSMIMVLQYWGFQFLGGVLAAIFFGVTHAVDHEEHDESQEEGDEEKDDE